MLPNHPSIKAAIDSFQPPSGYVVVPPRRNEKSLIFEFGVRISEAPTRPATSIAPGAPSVWMCLAADSCRGKNDVFYPLSAGKTSKATKHLREVHGIVSEKTQVEDGKKRSRDEELDRVRLSQLFRTDPGRMYTLLETLRIVNNNLPFRLAEYEESISIRELVMKDCIYASVNAKVVAHAIVELYSASKNFIVALLATNRIGTAASFTVVLDFWSPKSKSAKFLGLRLYFIDESFTLRSILLGVRHFNPRYSERAGGIRGPFMRWVSELLSDFGLSTSDLFGSTTDAGPDVKWMAQNGMQLNWEWCIPHLTNAATKRACGMVGTSSSSKNPPLTDLLGRVVKTIYQTKHVEVMGSLFKELCQMGSDDFERCPQQLLEYKAHRFLGLTRVIRRILCLWDALVAWYGERLSKAQREGKEPPSPFPLSHERDSLIQLLSMLEPITVLNRRAQGETANQVEVLLTMFKLRLTTLNVTSALRDYRSKPDNNMYFRPDQLMPVMANTRSLLNDAFQRNFFSRYTDRKKMLKCSFISEIQLFLHPNFKQLDVLKDVILLCSAQQGVPKPTAERNVVKVRDAVYDKLRALMKTVVVNEVDGMLNIFPVPPPVVFSEDLMELFSDATSEPIAPEQQQDINESRCEEELQRWLVTPTTLRRTDEGKPESVLSFWKRQQESGTFRLLPLAARIIYAMPVSSAQIERDFGVAGRMVTPQRSSIAPHNIDMSIFLSCNREYVDLTQCDKISTADARSHIPGHVLVTMDPDDNVDYEEMVNGYFSGDSANEDDDS